MKYPGLCAGLLMALSTFAQPDMDESHAQQHDPEKLGTVSFPTSCAPTVQKSFERGVALLHSFAYDKAEAKFTDIARQDPNCAMAHWGISLSMGKNYNYPHFPPEKAKAAWEALVSARARRRRPSRKQIARSSRRWPPGMPTLCPRKLVRSRKLTPRR